MSDENKRSKLVRMTVRNIGCIGNDGITIELDKVVCLVGKNNAGKSTILKAYELAKGDVKFDPSHDRSLHAKENPSEIILEVHIPDGIANIGSDWKIDIDGLRIVRSRWQWCAPNFKRVRTSWHPKLGNDATGDWHPDKNAAGLDNVFSSRLPRPLRIGSLDDAGATEETLLNLALTPLLNSIELEKKKADSDLAKAISNIAANIEQLSGNHADEFNRISDSVTKGFQSVFPSLGVKLSVAAAPLTPKVDDLIKRGSGLKVIDGEMLTTLSQQGTGARRALFWAMLQVHNELSRAKEVRSEYRAQLNKQLVDEDKKRTKAKGEQKDQLELSVAALKVQLEAHDAGAPITESSDDPAFPGYLLLIDEPENALHPMAARAAQRHLYQLASDPDWQVLMTTHSPYFINPFEDHTTIVRLERDPNNLGSSLAPKTYRSAHVEFVGNEKERLSALQHIDPSLSEIFFGSYPILVEGDTEHAAFISSIIERNNVLRDHVTVIRARGKAILCPLIKIMKHFKIDFGIIHDCYPPFRKDGSANGMWSENHKIREAVAEARAEGLVVRHRISVPDFERFLGGEEESKDKPLNAYASIKGSDELAMKVQNILTELTSGPQHEPFSELEITTAGGYMPLLQGEINKWAVTNGLAEHPRFKGKQA